MAKKSKNTNLYLSDKPPLNFAGKVGLAISYIILTIWALLIIVPLVFMVVASFNGEQQKYLILGSSFTFSLKHYSILFNKTLFSRWVLNTIVIATATALFTLLIVSFTGYVYSRFRFKGKKVSLMAIMLIQVIPAFAGIAAYYTMHQIIVSIFPFFTRTLMLISIYSIGGIAGNTFILKGYIDSISPELDEAARMEGSSNMQVYRLIIMPIAKPMLAIIALWSFIGPFMDFLLPRILLTNPKQYTLAAGLFTLISDDRTRLEPVFAAGGILTAIPIVLLFIVLQKQLVSGLSSGSVKG
ncbi:sugar ABC transporter permease [Streptobacillus moniliformis]|uniref:Binding-protein-dependent transport systems inner membrane component n=1 Tax=Streptobacillus moniliformis (strain ATCC 14647 / DSM 12112 / NCTC 10651 / 9901) TaxID=519441 RepID=D1AX84_STRM9|nr:sugar ABC transporter permease [Streptobacillus moniliformis]ACZ00910.1 binding-protein-dependent transport systems inner membrane component [Streptobacillus moniliformis DSM 12112]AVL42704.1 sugar ABC transporter permease [Streptobacillus moniliformis]SQA13951.1 Maltose transport system permease protein malG [Streptobacillus moniliformis]SQA14893.1 Maltose transport system permease protein malG [Streptobacillus moniliformis]SQA14894.1 Maltose transport system permease protein malG [Strepto